MGQTTSMYMVYYFWKFFAKKALQQALQHSIQKLGSHNRVFKLDRATPEINSIWEIAIQKCGQLIPLNDCAGGVPKYKFPAKFPAPDDRD